MPESPIGVALEAFERHRIRLMERFDHVRGVFVGAGRRSRGPHGVEHLTVAWRCATTY